MEGNFRGGSQCVGPEFTWTGEGRGESRESSAIRYDGAHPLEEGEKWVGVFVSCAYVPTRKKLRRSQKSQIHVPDSRWTWIITWGHPGAGWEVFRFWWQDSRMQGGSVCLYTWHSYIGEWEPFGVKKANTLQGHQPNKGSSHSVERSLPWPPGPLLFSVHHLISIPRFHALYRALQHTN